MKIDVRARVGSHVAYVRIRDDGKLKAIWFPDHPGLSVKSLLAMHALDTTCACVTIAVAFARGYFSTIVEIANMHSMPSRRARLETHVEYLTKRILNQAERDRIKP